MSKVLNINSLSLKELIELLNQIKEYLNIGFPTMPFYYSDNKEMKNLLKEAVIKKVTDPKDLIEGEIYKIEIISGTNILQYKPVVAKLIKKEYIDVKPEDFKEKQIKTIEFEYEVYYISESMLKKEKETVKYNIKEIDFVSKLDPSKLNKYLEKLNKEIIEYENTSIETNRKKQVVQWKIMEIEEEIEERRKELFIGDKSEYERLEKKYGQKK